MLAALPLAAQQRLVIGEKAPELKIMQWVGDKPEEGRRARLIEFFQAGGAPSVERLPKLWSIAKQYHSTLTVILVSKDSEESLKAVLPSYPPFFTGIDGSGATFSAYSVKFVPFSVLTDDRGRILWFGNSASLTNDLLMGLLPRK